jgi:hypothetical protein
MEDSEPSNQKTSISQTDDSSAKPRLEPQTPTAADLRIVAPEASGLTSLAEPASATKDHSNPDLEANERGYLPEIRQKPLGRVPIRKVTKLGADHLAADEKAQELGSRSTQQKKDPAEKEHLRGPRKLPTIGSDKTSDNEGNSFSLANKSNHRFQQSKPAHDVESEKEAPASQGSKRISHLETDMRSRDTNAKTQSKSASSFSKSLSPGLTKARQKQQNYKAELEIINETLNNKRDKAKKDLKNVKEVKHKDSPRKTDTFALQNRKKFRLDNPVNPRGFSAELTTRDQNTSKQEIAAKKKPKLKDINPKDLKEPASGKKEGIFSGRMKPSLTDYKKEQLGPQAALPEKGRSGTELLKNYKKLEYRESPDGATRKHSLYQALYQLFNGEFFPVTQPKLPMKYHLGAGNNSERVNQQIKRRKGVEMTPSPTSGNLVWTQLLCRYMRPTSLQSFTKLSVGAAQDLLGQHADLIKSAEGLAALFLESRLFFVADREKNAVFHSFEKLVSRGIVMSMQCESLFLNNHIRGIHYISRKYFLAKTIIDHCGKLNKDPFGVMPRTFFVTSGNYEADIVLLVKSVREIQEKASGSSKAWDSASEFKIPIIIKPGEYSNRGKGISIAYNERELKTLTNGLFSLKRSDQKAVLQTYLTNPLLYKKRKFDLRCYCLVVKHFDRLTSFWYSQGYARTSSYDYDERNKANLMVHLTNEAVQVQGRLA